MGILASGSIKGGFSHFLIQWREDGRTSNTKGQKAKQDKRRKTKTKTKMTLCCYYIIINGSLPAPLTPGEREQVNAMLDKARMARMQKDSRMDKDDGENMGPPDQHLAKIIEAMKSRTVVKERKINKAIRRVRRWFNCLG